MANLRATDLAQLISLSSWSQPRRRHHTDQYSFTTKLIPQDEDVLTQTPGSMAQWGTREQEPPGVDNTDFHHLVLSKTEHRAWRRNKSLKNLEINKESGGRIDQPSLNMKVTCFSEPWREEIRIETPRMRVQTGSYPAWTVV